MDDSSTAPPVIRVICGPTAAGKTVVSLRCARFAELAIVSADSRQLYRGFDVGTAKPSLHERGGIPHFGLDVLDPTQRASAAWWADRADGWIREAIAAGRTPLVVGGTGLYLRALFGRLFEEPAMDPARRDALQRELGRLDTDELRRWVERLDPPRARLGRAQLLRAIEIALLTGRRVSELHQAHRTTPRWRARYLVVDPGAALAAQIEERTRTLMSAGWDTEVRALMRTVPDDAPAWNATGYRTIRELVQERLTFQDAFERIVIETRQYAKRQRTWFRHQLSDAPVTRLDVREPALSSTLAAWWHDTDREVGS